MNTFLKQEVDAARRRDAAIRAAERALAQAFSKASLVEIKASQLRVRETVVREALRRTR